MAELFAGLDVSAEAVAICVLGRAGKPLLETSTRNDAKAVWTALKPYRRLLKAVGHEAGVNSPILHKQLLRRKLPAVCLDPRHTRAALAAQRNKTDRNDARDIAALLSRGFNHRAHVKSDEAQRIQTLLRARQSLIRKARDLQVTLRAMAALFGGAVDSTKGRFSLKFPKSAANASLLACAAALLKGRDCLLTEARALERQIERMAAADRVCSLLMTAPGVAPLTALTFKAAIDDPARFTSSRAVPAYFGLTSRRVQSGRMDFQGGISRMGSADARAALYNAAHALLAGVKRPCALKAWGQRLAADHGGKHARVACARKLAVILHRMWVTGEPYREIELDHKSGQA